jgi:hypothetical protein
MSARAIFLLPGPDLAQPVTQVEAHLEPIPSPLRPPCRANERIFMWRGVNTPPSSVVDHPLLHHLANIASRHSLRDPGSYGAGLRKFHLFCDAFSIAEELRLPAPFTVLNSFALWATAEPNPDDPALIGVVPYETVAPDVAIKYLTAVRAWHIHQGWPPPLSTEDQQRIAWNVRGLARLQAGRRSRPPRPPITISMLSVLRDKLDLSNSFDACIWAMAACGFWGMMRFGELAVKSRAAFRGQLHLKRSDVQFGVDGSGEAYVRLGLPSAKTAAPGEIQYVTITNQLPSELCPVQALVNLKRAVPALAADPLFSWRDSKGAVRPMVRDPALARINTILNEHGWGSAFGHSFRIGGASFYLGQGVSPEVVRVAGRWKSLAYKAYIRAFEQVSSVHMGGLAARNGY